MADKMATNLPADQRQQFKQMMTKDLDIAALSKAMTDAMVKHFTTEELKALADFYGSPVGKSAMQKFGAYMADLMPIIQARDDKSTGKTESIAALRQQLGDQHQRINSPFRKVRTHSPKRYEDASHSQSASREKKLTSDLCA
jgi:hypothetical protein